MEEYLMGFDASFFGFNDSQAAAVSEFFKKTLDQNFLPSLCGGIMNSYESMMESMAVILFRGSFVPFWKGRFFFFSDPDTFFFRTRTQKIDEKRKQTQNAWDLVCAGFTNGSHSKKLNGSWCLGGEFCSFLEAFHGL